MPWRMLANLDVKNAAPDLKTPEGHTVLYERV
jgi:hypothetical protein